MKKFAFVLVLLALRNISIGQSLFPPLEEMPIAGQGFLVLKNGDKIQGKLAYVNSPRGITKVALKDDAGTKHEYKVSDIYEFAIANTKWVQLQLFNESGQSIKKLLLSNPENIRSQDFVLFRNVKMKGGKDALLQILNPHFDERFQVYHDPFASKTTALENNGITFTGEMDRAYFIVKDNGPMVKIKKGSYAKSYGALFLDCPDMLKTRNPKFKDLGMHIYYYTNACGQETKLYFGE
jgi:hypothetical protein